MPRSIIETYPQYVIDDIELNEEQCREYDDLLDDCAGDEELCKEVWRLTYFPDGDSWIPMDAVKGLENDPELRGAIEGEDLPDLKEPD